MDVSFHYKSITVHIIVPLKIQVRGLGSRQLKPVPTNSLEQLIATPHLAPS
jgi:hypothetical protein